MPTNSVNVLKGKYNKCQIKHYFSEMCNHCLRAKTRHRVNLTSCEENWNGPVERQVLLNDRAMEVKSSAGSQTHSTPRVQSTSSLHCCMHRYNHFNYHLLGVFWVSCKDLQDNVHNFYRPGALPDVKATVSKH